MAGKRIIWCNVGQPYSITSSAAGIIFTFGSVMDIRVGAMFALFIRHLARLPLSPPQLDPEEDGCATAIWLAHLTGCGGAMCIQGLAEPLRRVVKVPRLWA